MADYGVELRDANGRRFARVDGGLSYHYWGKVTVTMASGNTYYTAPLFGIPASVPISAFIFCDFGGNEAYKSRYGKAEVRQINGQWYARAFKSMADVAPSFVSATFYIFVAAQYITASKYGIQCFSAAGLKVYDSARPLLQICGVGNGGSSPLGDSVFFNRTPAKCAASYISASSWFFTTINGAAYWAITRYYGTVTTGQLKGFTGMVETLVQGGTPQTLNFANVPLIDAGYYDNFANLGNM